MKVLRRVSVCNHRLRYGLIGRNTFGRRRSAGDEERGTGAERKYENQASEREISHNRFDHFGSHSLSPLKVLQMQANGVSNYYGRLEEVASQ